MAVCFWSLMSSDALNARCEAILDGTVGRLATGGFTARSPKDQQPWRSGEVKHPAQAVMQIDYCHSRIC